ncbi:MAG TPA: hypothetical protein PLY87_24325 [Planctomycetaceae bacterium]|nr:hypothetical protein [Planctomycetaceae bacterium]HQZ68248.1 hypothetical protein [Planctomycetaceae bacterium]
MIDPIHVSPSPPEETRRCVSLGGSLLGSFALHFCLLAGLIVLAVIMPGELPPWDTPIVGTHKGPVTDAITVQVEVDKMPPEPAVVTRQQVEDAILLAQEFTPEEQQIQLDVLSDQLASVSTGESVSEVCNTLISVLGVEPVRSEPQSDPPPGVFDSDSGQISDVRRLELPSGGQSYVCILTDAEGRSLEVELDDIEGPQLFAVMQKIKSNPLLEQIYRNIATPLLQQKLGKRQNE